MRDKISHWLNGNDPLKIPSTLQSKLSEELYESKFVNAVSIIVHRLSNIPWYTQKEILEEVDLTKDELIKVNKYIRGNSLLQESILEYNVNFCQSY
jgi:hypothetical protein